MDYLHVHTHKLKRSKMLPRERGKTTVSSRIVFLPGVRSSGLEFGERTGPTPGSEFRFGERTWLYTGSVGSEFGERTRSNPGLSGLEKGTGRTLVRQVRSSKKGMGRTLVWQVCRNDRAEP